MKNKQKILYFVDCLEYGGIQKYISEIIDNINNYQIDILTLKSKIDYPLEDVLKSKGIKIYKINSLWSKNIIKNYQEARSFFENHHDYEIFHLHGTSKNYYLLKLAQKNNINIRITHAHSTDFSSQNIIKKIIGSILKNKLIKYSTNLVACSNNAGKWLFNNHEFVVLNNGIDCQKYIFNEQVRNDLRKKYHLENKIVIGNVGRLSVLKNPLFLIDLLKELVDENNNYFLVIIGTGELEDKIIKKIKINHLEENVLLLKNINDVYNYYNMFDIFICPSKKEGFNLSLIEAQINGLYCLVNEDSIPNEVIVSSNVLFMEKNNIKKYQSTIINYDRRSNNLNDNYQKYDVKVTTNQLEKYYDSLR